jgi:hypothetical protein
MKRKPNTRSTAKERLTAVVFSDRVDVFSELCPGRAYDDPHRALARVVPGTIVHKSAASKVIRFRRRPPLGEPT